MPPILHQPQDILTTPYGYSGQMSPETAVAEQALNRRRFLANLLTQRGLQLPEGKMVGRFYVAPSPVQGAASLASVLAGALGSRAIDAEQNELMKADRQSVVDAIQKYHADKVRPAAPTGLRAEAGSPAPSPQESPDLARGIAPRPDGPYSGQVGAVPMPDAGVQSDTPPIAAKPPDDIQGFPYMSRLDMRNPQQADMSQMATPASQAQPLPSQPAPAPMPQPQPAPPRRPTLDDLADLLTHQHPQVRQYGAMLAQQMQREQERDLQQEAVARQLEQQQWERGFGEKKLAQEGELKRFGIEENAASRAEMMKNTLAMKEMQLAQMERDSLRDAKSQEAAMPCGRISRKGIKRFSG
jgi:hypothetical protein